MANEFIHKAVGTSLTQSEYEGTAQHVFNSQARGDMVVATSASQLSRLAVGAADTILVSDGTDPSWDATPILNTAVAKGTWTASGTWTLPAFTLGGAITGASRNISGLGTIGSAAITSTGLLTVTVAGNSAVLQNTTDAASNEVLRLRGGNRATAVNDDEAYIGFMLDDDGGTPQVFARMKWIGSDISTDLDGMIGYETKRNNSLLEMFKFGFSEHSQGIFTFGEAATGDYNYTWYTNGGASMGLDGGTGKLTLPGVIDVVGNYITFLERAAPGAGAANEARMYAVVDGGTLTDMACVFQDGTVDIFAQEV